MKYFLLLLSVLAVVSLAAEEAKEGAGDPAAHTTFICNPPQQAECECEKCDEVKQQKPTAANEEDPALSPRKDIRITVVGQGVAPMTTSSPAQA